MFIYIRNYNIYWYWFNCYCVCVSRKRKYSILFRLNLNIYRKFSLSWFTPCLYTLSFQSWYWKLIARGVRSKSIPLTSLSLLSPSLFRYYDRNRRVKRLRVNTLPLSVSIVIDILTQFIQGLHHFKLNKRTALFYFQFNGEKLKSYFR